MVLVIGMDFCEMINFFPDSSSLIEVKFL